LRRIRLFAIVARLPVTLTLASHDPTLRFIARLAWRFLLRSSQPGVRAGQTRAGRAFWRDCPRRPRRSVRSRHSSAAALRAFIILAACNGPSAASPLVLGWVPRDGHACSPRWPSCAVVDRTFSRRARRERRMLALDAARTRLADLEGGRTDSVLRGCWLLTQKGSLHRANLRRDGCRLFSSTLACVCGIVGVK